MPQRPSKLNGILLFLLLGLAFACRDKVAQNPKEWAYLVAPQDKILVKMAITDEDRMRGFSGTKDADWNDDDGLLFVFTEEGPRMFWMPDTYFDLDMFYLDSNFKIVDLQRGVPHFIGRQPEDRIPRARDSWSRHVLEMKSKSEVAKRLKVGDQLRFQSPEPPPQIK